MAFDEWMFSEVLNHPGSIILRLYSWSEGAITFGCNQRWDRALDKSKVGATPIIRRITGGRALYHEPSELTYSIAVNDVNIPGFDAGVSIAKASRTIATVLVSFLESLGIESQYESRSSTVSVGRDFFHTAPCFASNSRHEIVRGVDASKVVASAQRKIGDAIFQHGSIKISGVASHPALSAAHVKSNNINNLKALTVGQFDDCSRRFVESFRKSVGLEFVECELSEKEVRRVDSGVARVRKNNLDRRDIFKQK
ncbi:MAG: hypothetical protein AB1483_04015 [Candidatus Zixiibacteriota bacterium]